MTTEAAAAVVDEPEAGPSEVRPTPARTRTWSLPKAPMDRQQVEQMSRTVVGAVGKAATALGTAIVVIARYVGGVAVQIGRAFAAIPAALQLMVAVAALLLTGIAGTVALAGTAGVFCAVVLVPIAAITLGALGHRWFTQPSAAATGDAEAPIAPTSDLARSMIYVDKKLTLALNALGTDRHQQAVIALFQARTAVDLTLGTEQGDDDAPGDTPIHVDAYRLRPRIQVGATKPAIAEDNSLAAS
ncbi:hypothetical protein ACAG25_24180 [Mycobacterium sp. pV006]|uniref:hypothetical protein n=1 Tax=Mycobacterium sp. pV006 TaxID=3238983 RepID=UPI00351B8AC3